MYSLLYKVEELPTETGVSSVDIVFSFDTTGSMASVIDSVRENLATTVDRLFEEVKGVRIGIIVHGDYCDHPNMMWMLPLTGDSTKIKQFILEAQTTSGGDLPECYELVLWAASRMDWKAQVRVLTVIGDCPPHESGYLLPDKISAVVGHDRLQIKWQDEVKVLKEKNVTVFSCHALPDNNEEAIDFYETISSATGGYYFPLDDLHAFKDYMLAICYRAADSAEVLQELQRKQNELRERVQQLANRQVTTEEEQQELNREMTEIRESEAIFSSALVEARSNSSFTSPAAAIAARLTGGSSRLERFRSSLEQSSETTRETMDILSQPAFTPARRSYATAGRGARRRLSPDFSSARRNRESDSDDDEVPAGGMFRV